MGDFNAHHINWNCSKTDNNGKNFYESLLKSNLILHNDNSHTYIQAHNNYTSNIDLIFSSNNLSHRVKANVKSDTWGSDHFPISVEIDIEKFIYHKKCFKIKAICTNWDLVELDLNERYCEFLSHTFDCTSPSEKYHLFINIICDTIKKHTLVRKNVNKKIQFPGGTPIVIEHIE